MASMLLKPVFQATIGFLVNKGRGLAAEKLKDGDVADEKFRTMIMSEMDKINSKLDGLARKDLVASITFLKQGIMHLGKALDVETSAKDERGAVSTQADGAVGGVEEKTVLLATKEMKNLQLTGLNEEAKEALSDAKKRFKDARRKAVEAFGNSALSTSDRLLAMSIRIMATVLEKVDNPASALPSCRLCLEELHSLPAVQENFRSELKKGIKSMFGKDERNQIIVAVCQMNRVIYDVTQMVDGSTSKARNLLIWPCIDVGEESVHSLRDPRIAFKLRRLGMERFCLQAWSFGQEGGKDHRLGDMTSIATNTKGHFIIAGDKDVNVFDSSGKFLNSLSSPDDTQIKGVATDRDDKVYILMAPTVFDARSDSGAVHVFDTQANLHHNFPIRPGYDVFSLTVDDSNNVLVALRERPRKPTEAELLLYGRPEPPEMMVEVYDNNGRLLHSIQVMCQNPSACRVSSSGDGRVMVLDSSLRTLRLFSKEGVCSFQKRVQTRQASPKDRPAAMTFHRASDHLFIVFGNKESGLFQILLYNKDGEFVVSLPLDLQTEPGHDYDITGIVVTNDGCIALAVNKRYSRWQTLFIV